MVTINGMMSVDKENDSDMNELIIETKPLLTQDCICICPCSQRSLILGQFQSVFYHHDKQQHPLHVKWVLFNRMTGVDLQCLS